MIHDTHHESRDHQIGGQCDARPSRDRSWWRQMRREHACASATNHCWHPEGLIDWWCCECSAATDGMPPHRCTLCSAARGDTWDQAPLPARWHRCRAHTTGYSPGLGLIKRCPCGGWWRATTGWTERNTRRRGQ